MYRPLLRRLTGTFPPRGSGMTDTINWNSTQMNQRLPIPIRAARKVGEVLKYMKEGQVESSDYRKYI